MLQLYQDEVNDSDTLRTQTQLLYLADVAGRLVADIPTTIVYTEDDREFILGVLQMLYSELRDNERQGKIKENPLDLYGMYKRKWR